MYICYFGMYDVSSFFSTLNTLSYDDMSMIAPLFLYVNSDELSKCSFVLTLYPSSDITCIWILSSGYNIEILSSIILFTKYSLCVSGNIFRVSSGSIVFQSTHLTPLFILNPLVSGCYTLDVSPIWLSAHPTRIALNVLSIICFLILSCLVT